MWSCAGACKVSGRCGQAAGLGLTPMQALPASAPCAQRTYLSRAREVCGDFNGPGKTIQLQRAAEDPAVLGCGRLQAVWELRPGCPDVSTSRAGLAQGLYASPFLITACEDRRQQFCCRDNHNGIFTVERKSTNDLDRRVIAPGLQSLHSPRQRLLGACGACCCLMRLPAAGIPHPAAAMQHPSPRSNCPWASALAAAGSAQAPKHQSFPCST